MSRWWIYRFRRRRGPRVRFWDKDFNLLYAEPIRVESWPAWRKRQIRRVVR
jgi:hypothetical protein